jgi:hypothetical protein
LIILIIPGEEYKLGILYWYIGRRHWGH